MTGGAEEFEEPETAADEGVAFCWVFDCDPLGVEGSESRNFGAAEVGDDGGWGWAEDFDDENNEPNDDFSFSAVWATGAIGGRFTGVAAEYPGGKVGGATSGRFSGARAEFLSK